VGAPKYDTSSYQERVVEAGAVFKCTMQDDECQLVAFDSKGMFIQSIHSMGNCFDLWLKGYGSAWRQLRAQIVVELQLQFELS